MEIDHNRQAELAGPLHRADEVGVLWWRQHVTDCIDDHVAETYLSRDIRFVVLHIDRPVAEGDADGVQTGVTYICQVPTGVERA